MTRPCARPVWSQATSNNPPLCRLGTGHVGACLPRSSTRQATPQEILGYAGRVTAFLAGAK